MVARKWRKYSRDQGECSWEAAETHWQGPPGSWAPGLGKSQTTGPKVTSPLLVPLTIPITAWGRGHKPLTRMCRGLGKPRYWVTHDPKVPEDGWNGSLSWRGTTGFLSHYPFLNGAAKSLSYLANPKLGKKEIITEREAKGSKNKQVHPWISGFLWGFNNWHSVQPGAAHHLVSSGEEQEALFLGNRQWMSSVQGVGFSLLSPK